MIDADGSILPVYRKVHIPHDPLFYEKSYFSPGEEIRVYDTRYGKIAGLICFDQWFPEAARLAALAGAEIIFYPTAIGWIRGQEEPEEGDWHDAWETVQRGHAIASSISIAAVTGWGGRMTSSSGAAPLSATVSAKSLIEPAAARRRCCWCGWT